MGIASRLLEKVGKKSSIVPIDDHVKQLLDEFRLEHTSEEYFWEPPDFSKTGQKILSLPDRDRLLLIRHLLGLCFSRKPAAGGLDSLEAHQYQNVHGELLKRLLRRKMELSQAAYAELLDDVIRYQKSVYDQLPYASVIAIGEKLAAREVLDERLEALLRRLAQKLSRGKYAALLKHGRRIDRLLHADKAPPFENDSEWVNQVNALTESLAPERRSAWLAVLRHANSATTARPAKKWIACAQPLINKLEAPVFADLATRFLGFVVAEKYLDLPLASDTNSTTVKGLVWMTSVVEDQALLTAIHTLGEFVFKKVPGHGPGSAKVGNAVIYALAAQPGIVAISRLTALRSRVKYRQAQTLIERALSKAAEERGLSVATLEEIAVPTMGMNEDGRKRQQFGEYSMLVNVGIGGATATSWQRADGKLQKTTPKSVKESFPDELKVLRSENKELTGSWRAQRDRIEKMMLRSPEWSWEHWRKHYIDHPFVQTLARQLIWHFNDSRAEKLACWSDGCLRTVDGAAATIDDKATVTLWHPIGHAADTVLSWRKFLENHAITQPFKQAHREVYLVTDAERQTDVYSNRFAGHILRQHQLAAICQQRGWSYSLQGAFDSSNPPKKTYADFGVIVEYFCEAVGDDNPLSDSGIYLYVATDQVRFSNEARQPIPVHQVPPRLFTEAMRDVDLFVGVCSIGSDPNWADSGDRHGFNAYWNDYAFGELSEAAKIRKEVLERIVPKLKIASQLSIRDRSLVVEGKLRTYRIHIGSGNVQMEPNDQYLCIVQGNQGRRGASPVFLPFEGDGRLSVILSKAAMLAADDKIKDRTILSQIGQKLD